MLSAAAFWAQERSITQKRPRCLRLPHRRVPGTPTQEPGGPANSDSDPERCFPLMVTMWKGRDGFCLCSFDQGTSGNQPCHCRAGTRKNGDPAPTYALAVRFSRRLSHPPSLLRRRGFGKLDLFTALLLTACFPVELYSISGKGGSRG